MKFKVEDERQFMMECPAYQETRANFQVISRNCLMIVKVT